MGAIWERDAPVSAFEESDSNERLVEVRGLTKGYPARGGKGADSLVAVRGVDLDVAKGEVLGLVGESGCGKSTTARCLLRLEDPTSGRILVSGTDVLSLSRSELREFRAQMQMVFQDPSGSLDPRMTVRDLVEEPLIVHGYGDDRTHRRSQVFEMLERVGLSSEQAARKPHAFSGGQRQRIAIARALVLHPELVVLDEPVTSLDVSVQAQVLNLLAEVRDDFALTYLFIVHDLAVAESFCDRIAVMYLGRIVETASTDELFARPQHPYTSALLSAAPGSALGREVGEERIIIRGEPGTDGVSHGCRFRPRCPVGRDRSECKEVEPELETASRGHSVACHFPGELGEAGVEFVDFGTGLGEGA